MIHIKLFENFAISTSVGDYNIIEDWDKTPREIKGTLNDLGTLVMASDLSITDFKLPNPQGGNYMGTFLDDTPIFFVEFERAPKNIQGEIMKLNPNILKGYLLEPSDLRLPL